MIWPPDETIRPNHRRGGLGSDGGFVEVSGKQQLAFTGQVDTTAPMGKTGDLLLDPANITISNGADTGGFAPTTNNSVVNVGTLQNALATNNVTVTTSGGGTQAGDITVAANVTWASNSALTLSANHDIIVNNGVAISNTGAGSLNLRADSLGTGSGASSRHRTGRLLRQLSDWSIYYSADNPANSIVNPRLHGAAACARGDDFKLCRANQLTAMPVNRLICKTRNSRRGRARQRQLCERDRDLERWRASPVGQQNFTGEFDGQGPSSTR